MCVCVHFIYDDIFMCVCVHFSYDNLYLCMHILCMFLGRLDTDGTNELQQHSQVTPAVKDAPLILLSVTSFLSKLQAILQSK